MSAVLPDSVLKCLDKKDRPPGKAGWTKEECLKHAESKSERELQTHICSLLRRRGIAWFGYSRTDRRSNYTVGFPDFVIPIHDGVTLYWEVKLPSGKVSPEQDKCLKALSAQGQKVSIITSYAMAVAVLDNALAGRFV